VTEAVQQQAAGKEVQRHEFMAAVAVAGAATAAAAAAADGVGTVAWSVLFNQIEEFINWQLR
jgi:hypothetical protein